MVIPLFKVTSRLDSRLIKKESERVLPALAAIEAIFLEALFDDNLPYTYRAIYHVFRLEYRASAKRLNKYCHNKMLKLDEDYFDNLYRPLEYVDRLRD